MEDGLTALINTPGGIAGSIATTCVTAMVLLRKFMHSDKVTSATANATVEAMQRLTDIADRAEARAALADQRADAAYRERNEAMQKIGELTQQVHNLQTTVEELRRIISAQSPR